MSVSADDIIYAAPLEPSAVSWTAIFGNDRPVEVEIGTGKGGFLLEQAKAHPQVNYFGIEWANKYFLYAADRMARWGLTNARMCRTDAKVFVCRCVPEDSVAALHVYHPDPWPKTRHQKRRLFSPDFLAAVTRVLQDRACISFQTDHFEYGEAIMALLGACPDLERTLDVAQNEEDAQEIIVTNFQIKYRQEGRAIRRQTYRRKPRV